MKLYLLTRAKSKITVSFSLILLFHTSNKISYSKKMRKNGDWVNGFILRLRTIGQMFMPKKTASYSV